MFRHKGKRRTYKHNLRLASILSFVAGTVNITGVLSVKVLTTNVTGHFAYFGEQFLFKNYRNAIFFLLYILSFLAGSFLSNFLIEAVSRKKDRYSYLTPIIIEASLLSTIAFFGNSIQLLYGAETVAFTLLFAMGLQNALVTTASQSVVRTTHLTGLFTDLGIELSQIFFFRKTDRFHQLKKSILLKLAIISFFFSGCVIGGFIYRSLTLQTLLFSSFCLIIALLYDWILFHFYHIKRRLSVS
ncbi:YoaK family protein [Arachidicoccus sp.]|jgi:uncharacterized membrane protein YoaK (UPF0700 family)|uniref:YoaK family protein n=1 Tax=Arachidicoccus sp. TaxID=1872624 RepID=UPI003D1B2DB7